jgi:hypothetical protein
MPVAQQSPVRNEEYGAFPMVTAAITGTAYRLVFRSCPSLTGSQHPLTHLGVVGIARPIPTLAHLRRADVVRLYA